MLFLFLSVIIIFVYDGGRYGTAAASEGETSVTIKILFDYSYIQGFGKTEKTREDSTKGVPFVVTFHSKLTFLTKKINELFKYLHIDLEVKAVFTPTPMVLFRSATKIQDYLVRAELYPIERNTGSRKCNKIRRKVCNNIESTNLFCSTVTDEAYKTIFTFTVIVNNCRHRHPCNI